jgi:hypothetical protein
VGFVDTVGTPFAFPFGVLPPPLVLVSVIFANATPPNDIDSANISAAINNVMRLRIRFLSSIIPVYRSLAFLGYRSDCCVP